MAPEWMHTHAQTPSVLVCDTCVRIFFCTRPPADSEGQFTSLIGFIDVDKSSLSTIKCVSSAPPLSLGQGGTFDEYGTNPVSVIRVGDEVRAYYAGWTRCESVPFNAAIGVASSRDNGYSFHRFGPGPILSYSPDEPFVIGSPKIRRFDDVWYLHYAVGRNWLLSQGRAEPVYRIRHAISSDGLDWTKAGRDIIEARLGPEECQAGADITFYGGLYHMFFSYRHATDFKNKARGYRIGYAYSSDLMNWTRRDESVGIDVSEKGWDSEMVSYAHVFEANSTLYMLYQGNGVGRDGFGLAKLEDFESGGHDK